MVAVFGMLLILVGAGGVTHVLSIGTFTGLGIAALGIALLVVGVHSEPVEKPRNGYVRRRG